MRLCFLSSVGSPASDITLAVAVYIKAFRHLLAWQSYPCDRKAAVLNSSCAKSASSILPPSKRDTNTRLIGKVPPRGMFCMLGIAAH